MPRINRSKKGAAQSGTERLPRNTAGPTPERLAKASPEEVEVIAPDQPEGGRVIRLTDGHVLEHLRSRQCISSGQYEAGQRFYSDWYDGGLAASGVVDPGRLVVDGSWSGSGAERRLDALQRWRRAVQAVGLVHASILCDILLAEERLEAWGRRRRGQVSAKLARHAAITAISLALEALDHHYRPPRSGRVRTSHVADYRPSVQRRGVEET